ncbi:hypothetical protein B0H65DRAFT_509203 [Neurospora tetraspora]|uniref:Chitin-binding type-4 domain-containing protein n=1 Tax=Neurospora tetraspora TaxID=94610 RepID=A0AAE0JFV5_9PEZI|nr:hypothetical protein B0H65DRAFT_509203 [Neurospora tetraspora]
MQLPLLRLVSLLGLLSGATAHGLVQNPPTRSPGDATAAACGKTMANFYKADNTSYPEALLRANPGGLKDGYNAKNCNLWLCKGYQFGDNKAGVQQYVGGQEVVYKYANVSVVDTTTNSAIGSPLLAWPSGYAASSNPPKNHTDFKVKIPDNLGGRCSQAGVCVLQWYWFGQAQTYESCTDFVVPEVTAAADSPIRKREWWA